MRKHSIAMQNAIDEIAQIEKQDREDRQEKRRKESLVTCGECQKPLGFSDNNFELWAKLVIYRSNNTAIQFDCPNCGKRLYARITIDEQPSKVPF